MSRFPNLSLLHSVQCRTVTSRSHVKDYRPRPAYPLPKRPFIPPRKKDAFLTHPTPTIDAFETSFDPIKAFEPIQQRYEQEQDENNEEVFRKVWPFKKWLWRSDKHFENKAFDSNNTLHYFIEDENNSVGRCWYPHELRVKSNEDLWKLWYVLLRERNMLNSMRFACRAAKRQMPNYGRLQKVRKSMMRLQFVWKERTALKIANLHKEQKEKRDLARNNAIEYRRAKQLERREIVKAMFFEYVDALTKKGKNVNKMFPKLLRKRERTSKQLRTRWRIDEAMKAKPVLSTAESLYIPKDLLEIIRATNDKIFFSLNT